MKISWRGALRLKPFDEASDRIDHGTRYAGSVVFAVAIVLGSVLAIGALLLAIIHRADVAFEMLMLAVALSAVTAGLEWNAGMRARALNQLFVVLLCAVAIFLLANQHP